MHRVFETQELVTAICNSLYAAYEFDPGDRLEYGWYAEQFKCTGLVSTHFFHGMLPYIWEYVKVLDVFKRGLIPAELAKKRDKTQVHISEPISPETMARFHLYAPYIKVLRVPVDDNAAEVLNWEPLAAYAKNNELLPNLVEFECGGFDLQTISVFLSGSTKKVTIDRLPEDDSDDSDDSDSNGSDVPKVPRKGLDMASARQLLEHTACRCPNLHSLEFHPYSDEIVDAPTSLHNFTFPSDFKGLRRLVSTPVVLQSSSLQLVAQLPNLNTLSIKPYEHGGHWDSSLCEQVPGGGFPALSDLTLLLEEPRDAKRFWELIPLQALKNLDLTIISPSNDNELQFIPVLCRASPLITDLRLTFRHGWGNTITAEMFEYLACLPIESYSFLTARLDFEGAWAKIAGSWPNLRSIRGYQPANLDELLFLSSNLPKLENIECDFDLERAATTVGSDWMPAGRPPFHPNPLLLEPLRSNFRTYGSEVRGLARFFAYFWPNLNIKYVGDDRWQEYTDHDEKDLRRMSQAIMAANESMFVMFKELILAYVHLFHPDLVSVSRDV